MATLIKTGIQAAAGAIVLTRAMYGDSVPLAAWVPKHLGLLLEVQALSDRYLKPPKAQ